MRLFPTLCIFFTRAICTLNAPTTYLFSFGDSYTDTSFSPLSTLPSPSCPLGNPSCLTGSSYTGGYNWLSTLSTLANTSLVQTYNFAHSGDVLSTPLAPRPGVLQSQLPKFQTLQKKLPWRAEEAVFSVFIGVNDVDLVWRTANESWWTREFTAYRGLLDTLYVAGARRFLLQEVPPLERMPRFLSTSNATRAAVRSAVVRFNFELRKLVGEFPAVYNDVVVTFWEGYAFYNTVLDAPESYGFVDAVQECETGGCFWHDGFHPSEKAQMLLGESVAESLEAAEGCRLLEQAGGRRGVGRGLTMVGHGS